MIINTTTKTVYPWIKLLKLIQINIKNNIFCIYFNNRRCNNITLDADSYIIKAGDYISFNQELQYSTNPNSGPMPSPSAIPKILNINEKLQIKDSYNRGDNILNIKEDFVYKTRNISISTVISNDNKSFYEVSIYKKPTILGGSSINTYLHTHKKQQILNNIIEKYYRNNNNRWYFS